MGKVRRVMRLLARKAFYLRLGAILAVAIGIISGVFGITGWHLEWGYALILAIGTAIVLAQMTEPSVYAEAIPVHDSESTAYRLLCPCSRALADSAKNLAASYFGTTMNIDPNVYEQLRLKNPYILGCLTNARGELVGYFDAIPLEENFAQSFLRGHVTELQINHENVLPPEAMKSCKFIYLAGIAARGANSAAGGRYTRMLVWAFFRYLEHFYGEGGLFAFAVASTPAGDALAQRLKMNLESDGRSRIDHFKLYSIVLSREEFEERRPFIEDCSGQCTLDWDRAEQHVARKSRRASPPLRTFRPAKNSPQVARAVARR